MLRLSLKLGHWKWHELPDTALWQPQDLISQYLKCIMPLSRVLWDSKDVLVVLVGPSSINSSSLMLLALGRGFLADFSGWCYQACNVGQNNFISFCLKVNLDIKCRLEFVLAPVFGCNFCVVCQQCEAYHSFSNWQIFTSQPNCLKLYKNNKKLKQRIKTW